MAKINQTTAVSIYIKTGTTYTLPVKFLDSNGAPADKSTYTSAAKYWLTKDMSAGSSALTVDSTNDSTGVYLIEFPDTLVTDTYYGVFEMTDGGGDSTISFEFTAYVSHTHGQYAINNLKSNDQNIIIKSIDESVVINHRGTIVTNSGINTTGMPTSNDFAQFTNATTIQGIDEATAREIILSTTLTLNTSPNRATDYVWIYNENLDTWERSLLLDIQAKHPVRYINGSNTTSDEYIVQAADRGHLLMCDHVNPVVIKFDEFSNIPFDNNIMFYVQSQTSNGFSFDEVTTATMTFDYNSAKYSLSGSGPLEPYVTIRVNGTDNLEFSGGLDLV